MSTPTVNDVVLTLSSLGRQLDAKQTDIARLDEEAVKARSRYETTYARTFLNTEGAMDVRKYTAVLESADMKFDAEIAEQVLRAARESIKVLRDRLDIGRSLNSAIRSEWGAQAAGQAGAA